MILFAFGIGLAAAFGNLVGSGIWRLALVIGVALPVLVVA
jgi:hypothetical protein